MATCDDTIGECLSSDGPASGSQMSFLIPHADVITAKTSFCITFRFVIVVFKIKIDKKRVKNLE